MIQAMTRRGSPASAGRSLAKLRPPRLTVTSALFLLLAAAAAGPPAVAVPATPPVPQAMAPLHFPAFAERTLANGLRIVLVERHTVPAVSLRLVVAAGQVYEPADRAGLAEAAAELLTQGTATRSAQQIAAAIDGVGGSLGAGSSPDFAFVSAGVTSDQTDLALDLLADVVLHPSFPAAEIERWRRKTLSALEVQRADGGSLANQALRRMIFGNFPYGAPADGTNESVAALTRDDLVAFHRAHFVPNGSILAVVGDFQPEAALRSVERALGAWPRGAAPRPPELPADPAASAAAARHHVLVIDKPDAVQTQVLVGQRALAYTDPDFFTATVYGTVLGGGSSARLFQQIRRQRGLAYGAYCSFSENALSGSFTASTSTKTASTVEALKLTLELIAGMGREAVPAPELAETKAYLNGSFPLEIETSSGVASRILAALSHGLGRNFLDGYRERIAAVSAGDIQRFGAGRMHADHMVIVLVGNAAAFGADLAKLVGPYETIPAADFDPLAPGLRRAATPATATRP